jgi:signal transduction histidine kinase
MKNLFNEFIALAEITKNMTTEYRILFLEDNPDDVELMLHELNEANVKFVSSHVSKKEHILQQVYDFEPDVILVDYSFPSFNGMDAFRMIRQIKKYIPFILVTGAMSEKMALECLKEGVDDFILKSSFKRLPAAILSAIEKKETERERNRISSELKKSHNELKVLFKRQQTAREEERLSIARDMHDELGQVLTALKIDITMLGKRMVSGKQPMDNETISNEFNVIIKLVDQITQSVKRISSGLRPEILDELGILEAIRCQAQEFEQRSQIESITFLPAKELSIERDFAIAIFRIVQEALTNVARHAQATQVVIQLKIKGDNLFLEISDNGKGISREEIESSKSFGLIGLRERVSSFNGKFDIYKKQSGGTVVSAVMPLEAQFVA